MRWLLFILLVFAIDGTSLTLCAQQGELWNHVTTSEELDDVRGLTAEFSGTSTSRLLRLNVTDPITPRNLAWTAVPAPREEWGLDRAESIQATFKNSGSTSITVMVWVVGSNGWGAVGSSISLDANETSTLKCNLRETYPDGTSKLDPTQIQQIRFMVSGVDTQSSIEVSDLIATGTVPQWVRPAGRLDLPAMQEGAPTPGRRVRYQLPGDAGSDIYGVLYLPTDWQPGKSYPVVVEYPGNIFYNTDKCWSTGRPEQCAMGYGMTEGRGAIWVSLPFVDRTRGSIAENGFGSNNGKDTADYAMDVITDICNNWGGDPDNRILSGFSRGAIACGYIGLHNNNIAALWKGFVACQHYDGSAWNQSNMSGAVQRAPRFRGQAIFQIDNAQEKYQPVVVATDPAVKWTWVKSGLRYHATAMCLDDRPSTQQLRRWFRNLTRLANVPSPGANNPVAPVDVSVLPEGVERVEVYLLMGQSNMKGRGHLPETQTTNPLILNMNMADDQWYPARHPLHKAGAPDLIDGSDKAGVGPGLAFARTLVKQKGNVLVALIPVAQGGSWINLWGDGSDNYEKTIRRANIALADFPPGKARIAGVFWLQGESDTLEGRYEAYAGKLTSLIERLRTDLNEPKLPFIACTIRPDILPKGKYLHVKEVNDDLLSLPQRVPHTACVDARDLKGHIGDFMHYNAEAQHSIGKRYAEEYFRLTRSVESSRPNFIVIFADDMGVTDIGAFHELYPGAPEAQLAHLYTPNLDQLAQEGVRFTRAYATPWCAPSRQMLLSGQWVNRRNAYDHPWIGNQLRQAGYTTGIVGKSHGSRPIAKVYRDVDPETAEFDDGFFFNGGSRRSYLEEGETFPGRRGLVPFTYTAKGEEYLTDVYTDHAVEFIENHADRPFMLYLPYNAPHGPLDGKPEDLRKLFPDTFADASDEDIISGPLRARTDKLEAMHFAAMVYRMDLGIGRIMKTLKEKGIDRNTLIIFASDNGRTFGYGDWLAENHPFTGHKSNLLEGGIRVPFFVWSGDLAASDQSGTLYDGLVSLADIAPTLMAQAEDKPYAHPTDGVNLMPYLIGEEAPLRGRTYFCALAGSPSKMTGIDGFTGKIYEGRVMHSVYIKDDQKVLRWRPQHESVLGAVYSQLADAAGKQNPAEILKEKTPVAGEVPAKGQGHALYMQMIQFIDMNRDQLVPTWSGDPHEFTWHGTDTE